jgi:hypothetical protein
LKKQDKKEKQSWGWSVLQISASLDTCEMVSDCGTGVVFNIIANY